MTPMMRQELARLKEKEIEKAAELQSLKKEVYLLDLRTSVLKTSLSERMVEKDKFQEKLLAGEDDIENSEAFQNLYNTLTNTISEKIASKITEGGISSLLQNRMSPVKEEPRERTRLFAS
jgi:hypothetical protein